jgi:hypothetical protein
VYGVALLPNSLQNVELLLSLLLLLCVVGIIVAHTEHTTQTLFDTFLEMAKLRKPTEGISTPLPR